MSMVKIKKRTLRVMLVIIFALFILLVVSLLTRKPEAEETTQEPQLVNYIYTPVEGFEFVDGIMPDEIVELDDFNKSACMIAQTLYGEARNQSKYEQSMVVWCILNRVDDRRMGTTIEEVITRPNQFIGYRPTNPIDEDLYKLAVDVLMRWSYEKYSVGDVGRALPKEYLFFRGHDGHNWFKIKESDNETYNLSSIDPYEE